MNVATTPAAVDPNAIDMATIDERTWVEKIHRPNEPQLTVRAVVVGMLIGALMCLSNLYVFFKTGWSMGVTLTAAILAFAVFTALERTRVVKRGLGELENVALTTVASGAGYMTGGGNMAAFGALLMVTAVRPEPIPMIAWFGVIAAMGVFAAIPIKRQLINQDKLSFPTGTATAETIRSIHAKGGSDGAIKAKALGWATLFAALIAFFRDAKAAWMPFNLPHALDLPFTLAGKALKDWTLTLKTEVVLIGAGALMSFRTGWSLLLGGILTYAVLAPSLLAEGAIKDVGYKNIVAWTLWPGAAMLVAAGLTSFALDYKSIARAFTGLFAILKRKKPASSSTSTSASGSAAVPATTEPPVVDDPVAAVEPPEHWFPIGFFALMPLVVILMWWLFQIPIWAGLIAAPLAVLMGFVAARVTGETDVTPTKALGPVTQLLYGVITPGNLSGNIMSANVTGGIGLHAADLLTTIKTGWLLGASPRVQVYAQLFGVVAGAAVVVPAFMILIPDPSVLGGDEWPAPSCLVWAGVSQAFSNGISSMPASAQTAALVAAVLGVALALLERFAPKALRAWVPSPNGVGIAMVIPGSNCIAMFAGSAIAEALRRWKPAFAERYTVPVSSGLIAGESLMGVLVALLVVAGVLSR